MARHQDQGHAVHEREEVLARGVGKGAGKYEESVVCLCVEAGRKHAGGRLCRWVGEGGSAVCKPRWVHWTGVISLGAVSTPSRVLTIQFTPHHLRAQERQQR